MQKQVAELRRQAEQCQRLAGTVGDRQTEAALRAMAAEYQEQAAKMQQKH